MDADTIAIIVALVIGPGSGFYMLRQDNKRAEGVLKDIRDHLATLNARVTKSENHISDLENKNGG